MNCTALLPSIVVISHDTLVALRVLNSVISLLNILGNTFLIYALKKTRQTTTVSLKLVLLMSYSDLITGITAISLTNALLWKETDSICPIKVSTAFIHLVSCGFSFGTVFLIALDRFLHMKYLQRYPTIVTKKRAYTIVVAMFSFFLLSAALFSSPALHEDINAIQLGYFMIGVPIIITTSVLYNRAIATTVRKISAINANSTQTGNTQSKKIFKAAKLISASFGILVTPIIVAHAILAIKRDNRIQIGENFIIFKWTSYIVSLANGFCSCLIFILQNRPVRKALHNVCHSLIRGEKSKITEISPSGKKDIFATKSKMKKEHH